MDEAIRKKLEAPLRQLYDDLMGAARRTGLNAAPIAPDAAAESGACLPERVGATVSFTGPRADLEAAGFDIASVFAGVLCVLPGVGSALNRIIGSCCYSFLT